MYAAAVPIFIRSLREHQPVTVFGDGGQTRDLIFVEDVARANLIAAAHPAAPGKVFNVCTGRQTTILDLFNSLKNNFPDASAPVFKEPRAGDIYKSLGSPEKARGQIGFEALTPLDEGLQETVAWMG